MIRTAALLGVIGGSGFIGWLGVSAVKDREKTLRILEKDLLRLTGMLAEQGMSLRQGLVELRGSEFTEEYERLSCWLRDTPGDELTLEAVGGQLARQGAFAELRPAERELFCRMICRLAECVAPGELILCGEWFSAEAERLIGELQEGDLKRAKVLRTIWLMGGMCAAIILI